MVEAEKPKPDVRRVSEPKFYDPADEHFTSQNRRNEFLKALESGSVDQTTDTLR